VIVRFVKDSIRRSPRRKAMIIAAIAMGSAVATSMLGVMLSIGDKINRELRQVGANIVVTAKAASLTGGAGGVTTAATGGAGYIPEAEVPKIKSIFWTLNITGFSPSLMGRDGDSVVQGVWFDHSYREPDGTSVSTGVKDINPTWVVRGAWAHGNRDEAMVGEGVATRRRWKPGMDVSILGAPFHIAAIVSSGDETDDRILIPLARLQQLTNRTGLVDRIEVAALTKPEDDFARKDPKTMSSAEYELWNCTGYVTVIAHEIEEALPGTQARAVRRVADSEGRILDRIGGLMALITLAALLSAGLTVWSLTATTMMERRGEIAIMQAIGGARWLVATMLSVEIGLIGIAGGLIGAFAGVALAKYVGQAVFHDAIDVSPVLPLVIMLAAMLVALAGAAQPLRRTLRLDPAAILREGV
jgi:putative ABC transport system permease protein